MPTLSVITLTCNRLAKVQSCLERLAPQLAPGDEWLLIDTGSADGTREHFAASAPPGVRLAPFEGEGSWAEMRNFGVAQARGALIAFLDDDCLPAADWVRRGKAALADADAVGGMAQPLGLAGFPSWWHPDMGWMVGLSVPGHAGPDAGRVHYPTTSNLWARALVCRAVPFQELGGRLGGEEHARYRTGREDAQWWRRLRVEGYRTRFDPRLTVGHAIDPARLDLLYLRRRAGLDGRAWAVREGQCADFVPLAYQWWRQFFLSLGRWWVEPEARAAHWHFHTLMRRRHGEALKGLEEKFLEGRWRAPLRWLKPWYGYTLGRLAWDRSKTVARVLLRPWLAAHPLRPGARQTERIAIFAFAYLGDLVILQSVLRGLAEQHPTVELYVLGPPAAAPLLRDVRRLNLTTIPPDLRPGSRKARQWIEHWLERLDPDAIVAPYLHEPWGRTLLSIRRPPRPIIGFDSDQGLRRLLFLERLSVKVCKYLDLHESVNLCALFEVAGLPCQPRPAVITAQPEVVARLRQSPWLAEHLRDTTALVMLNPDAGHAQKEWTDEAWIELLRLMLDRTGWLIALTTVKAHPALERVANEHGERVTRLHQIPIPELIGGLSLCDGLVTVDSGPQHLAHALGVPSLTLYGPMDERRWRDLWRRPIHRTLRACTLDLTPEEKRGLAVNHEVALIRPAAVFENFKQILPESDAD